MKFQCSSASRKFLKSSALRLLSSGSGAEFQCSSASRKFLKRRRQRARRRPREFQCSSASRKFLKVQAVRPARVNGKRFSALQRAENSSNIDIEGKQQRVDGLQRAENSSNPTLAPASIHISDRDDHASSFLSLPGASP